MSALQQDCVMARSCGGRATTQANQRRAGATVEETKPGGANGTLSLSLSLARALSHQVGLPRATARANMISSCRVTSDWVRRLGGRTVLGRVVGVVPA